MSAGGLARGHGLGGREGDGPAGLAARTCVPRPPPVPAEICPAPRRVRAFLPATCLRDAALPRLLGALWRALGPCPPER